VKRSKEKINYVKRYLTSYEAMIKASNSQGLFDEAKLFELFAQQICSLWFGQPFTNLNSIRKNYPHVDLLSADKKVYVQVSTTIALGEKIKSTIDDTANDKTKAFEDIDKIIFFTLSLPNKSAFSSYKNGRISFDPKADIISINDILSKALGDSDFLDKVYSLVKQDDELVGALESSLENCLSLSESVLDSIGLFIGGDYSIDRTKEVDEIDRENSKDADLGVHEDERWYVKELSGLIEFMGC